MRTSEIQPNEYAPFYMNYIALAKDVDLIEGLTNSGNAFVTFYSAIPENKYEYQYAQGKWTVKEILTHIMDAERIFCYRALCIARKDKTNLPGFNENNYAHFCESNNRNMSDLLADYQIQRQSTIALIKSFTNTMLTTIGKANTSAISVRALAGIIIGHEKHHLAVVNERYLK